MRKILALALVAPALFMGTVAADDAAPSPCGADLEHPILASGDAMSENPSGESMYQFYVDPTTTEKGRVTISGVLTWENRLNDYDLGINGTVTEGYQPLDEPTESLSVTQKGGCKLVTVTVEPYGPWAPFPVIGMTLDVTVG